MDRAVRLNITVRGLVQGIGFRMFATREASSLGLTGWTRNLPDGSVEIEVQGEKEQINTFTARAKQGPSRSQVTSVTVKETETESGETGFHIRY